MRLRRSWGSAVCSSYRMRLSGSASNNRDRLAAHKKPSCQTLAGDSPRWKQLQPLCPSRKKAWRWKEWSRPGTLEIRAKASPNSATWLSASAHSCGRATACLKSRPGRDTSQSNSLNWHRTCVRRLLRLAFLAPEIVEAIAAGRQPPELTAEALAERIELPLLWTEQAQAVGIS